MNIEYKEKNNIAVLELKRINKLNALNTKLICQLTDKLKNVENNDYVKCVIITGEDKSFIAGADINEMKQLDTVEGREFISKLHILNNTIRYNKKPVIAGVNGYCFGAGLELAVSCDIIIASKDALFGMQEVKLGIPSVIEASLLPVIIGLAKTRELLLTGKEIESQEAFNIGLINKVVSKEYLMSECCQIANEIINNSNWAVSLQKELINRWLENQGIEQSIKTGIDFFAYSLAKK